MKKKILFACYGLGIGGIEKCLVNLLNVLPSEKFDIDVLLMNPEYESQKDVTAEVNYLDSFRYVMNTTDTLHEIKKHGGISKNLILFLKYCWFRIAVKIGAKAWKIFKELPGEYDIAISYSQNGYTPYYVIDKVKARRKILWYHNGAYNDRGNKFKLDKIYYALFEKIVAVSNDCATMLQNQFDFEDNKLIVLHNICDVDAIVNLAKAKRPVSFKNEGLHIVTVGRMTSEKGAELAVESCAQLLSESKNIYWHWVGDGNQCVTIKDKIDKLEIQNRFILEGNQTNPYPYIKNADIYVQPSFYEAYSTTVTEARVLQRPIVVTDVGGMRDQLENGVNSFIVPIDVNEITNAVRQLIENKEMREIFSNALAQNPVQTDSLNEYLSTVLA